MLCRDLKGEVRTINDRNICERRSCMKNNGKSPPFQFVSGEERRRSEVQRVSQGWRLPGTMHSSADPTWIRKWLGIDNLQNYCLGTRYGARSRSRLCRRLSISLVRYRHGLEKFLEHHFIPIRRRFNPHDLPTDLLRVQDPFFFGEEGRSFRQETSMAWHGLFLCGRSSLI